MRLNPEPDRASKRALLGILISFGLLTFIYSVIIPFGEPPDEPAHYDYIRYLRNFRRLPLQSPDQALNPVEEGYHPPGYYALVALLTGWAPYQPYALDVNPYLPRGYDDPHIVQQYLHPASERFPWKGPLLAAHVARLASIGMSLLSIWVTYQIGKQIAPHDSHIALLAAGTHAFIPQFVYISSAINNDNAATLMGSLITWQMLRLLLLPTNAGFILLGVLMGLGVLAKLSLLAMLPAIGWTVWYAVARIKQDRPAGRPTWVHCLKGTAVKGGLVLVPILLLVGWWMWRNQRLYGDPLAWDVWMANYTWAERQLPLTAGYIIRFLWQQFRSFWGLFGWSRVFLPSWLYLLLLMLALLAGGGLIKHLAHNRQRDYLARIVLLFLIFVGLVPSTWRLGLRLDLVSAQGRYFFPALSAITTLLAIGWLAWWSPIQQAGIKWLCIGGLFALSVAVLPFHLAPAYARSLVTALPAEAQPVQGDFELWELVGWQAPQPVTGRTWPVTLYWRAQRELDSKERQLAPILFVHLVDANGEAITKWDGVPTHGRFPPPVWSPDVIVADTILLPVPAHDQARLAQLFLGFYFKEEDQLRPVAVRSSTHPTLPGTLLLGPVVLRPPQAPRFHIQRTSQARFGATESGTIRLLGYDLEEEQGMLWLVLYWQAEAEITTDYTVFVHLASAGGLVAQGDAPPCGGACPTSLWRAEDVWRDERFIPVASTFSARPPYTLSVGWYEPSTGGRLPAFSAEGERREEDRLPLCTFSTWPGGECTNGTASSFK